MALTCKKEICRRDISDMVIILCCRPTKDDGKKNEERTGVKKKGENAFSLCKVLSSSVIIFKAHVKGPVCKI